VEKGGRRSGDCGIEGTARREGERREKEARTGEER